jgi:hypothetical protein
LSQTVVHWRVFKRRYAALNLPSNQSACLATKKPARRFSHCLVTSGPPLRSFVLP